jgi:histidinol dehydrogenase
MLRRLDSRSAGFQSQLSQLLAFETSQDPEVDTRVAAILSDVKTRGDAAVLEYTQRFDAVPAQSMEELELTQAELKAAFERLPDVQKDALVAAAERVRKYHEHQKMASWQYTEADGTVLGQQVTALDRVGIYVPGGKASYPSSVLMNAIPAHVAGVAEIIMVVPTPRGERNDLVLAAAYVAARKPWARWLLVQKPCLLWIKSPALATPMWPPPNAECLVLSASIWWLALQRF